MPRYLIGSPVCQRPDILTVFLDSLCALDRTGLEVEFLFIDDNTDPQSSALLARFAETMPAQVLPGASLCAADSRSRTAHQWGEAAIWRVARFKDLILQTAREGQHDGVFLIDSDVLVHPQTLRHLAALARDIVAEVYWTRWQPEQRALPQVWIRDGYTLHAAGRGERLTPAAIARRQEEFLTLLELPGTYRVGLLGACTLIGRRALQCGVSFAEIPNLGLTGEDRHFCIRAAALGLELYADTHYPALHLYRPEDLAQIPAFMAAHAAQAETAAALMTLRKALSCRFDQGAEPRTGAEGLELFHPRLRAQMEASGADQARADHAAQNRSHLHVIWTRAALEPGRACGVEGELIQDGIEDGTPFRDTLRFYAVLEPDGVGWVVTDLAFQPCATLTLHPPFLPGESSLLLPDETAQRT